MLITMDVTFFEDKPFFLKSSLGGTRHVEELVEDDIFCIVDQGPDFCIANQNPDQNITNRGTDFTDFLEESPIPINQKKSFQNNIPEKSDVSIQSANEKEFETSENNDQALEKQISIENNKCLDSLALVPITKSNSPSARDRNVVEKKPQIYVRKNYRAKEKFLCSLHNQESKPRT